MKNIWQKLENSHFIWKLAFEHFVELIFVSISFSTANFQFQISNHTTKFRRIESEALCAFDKLNSNKISLEQLSLEFLFAWFCWSFVRFELLPPSHSCKTVKLFSTAQMQPIKLRSLHVDLIAKNQSIVLHSVFIAWNNFYVKLKISWDFKCIKGIEKRAAHFNIVNIFFVFRSYFKIN